ncbi:hypothetical protein ACIA5G_34205 [Amycolatopsis sp. NPDC051758]|uniref:hypothetical protein n=1 Tax=Amycolatopsis sp. NPDC051758 TaxID=3363935 RepID=UPI0037931810
MTQTTSRQVVEPSADGSWLIVDRGEDRTGRRAIERFADEPTGGREAGALVQLEDLAAALPARDRDEGFGAMFAAAQERGHAGDAVHDFDHLLPPGA